MLANYKRTLELQTEAIEQQAERLDVVEFKVEIIFIYSLVCFCFCWRCTAQFLRLGQYSNNIKYQLQTLFFEMKHFYLWAGRGFGETVWSKVGMEDRQLCGENGSGAIRKENNDL